MRPSVGPSTELRTNGLGVGRVGEWVGQGVWTPRFARGDRKGLGRVKCDRTLPFDGAQAERGGGFGVVRRAHHERPGWHRMNGLEGWRGRLPPAPDGVGVRRFCRLRSGRPGGRLGRRNGRCRGFRWPGRPPRRPGIGPWPRSRRRRRQQSRPPSRGGPGPCRG